jgi:Flp pilus assembly protein TadD
MADIDGIAADNLERLLGYLDADPANSSLLADAAQAAADAGQPAAATDLLDRLSAIRELNDQELHILGVAALQSGDHQRASAIYRSLMDQGIEYPAIRFNLAWSLTGKGERSAAEQLLDDATVAALPQAAMLKVQLLHGSGDLAGAGAAARGALERHPGHRGLLAAVSVLAVDLDDLDLARSCASGAEDHPDALATLGTLALEGDDAGTARPLFERALEMSANVPRAWVGLGLSRLAEGDAAGAAADIDRGAELFADHLGSFIAAGWAYFIAGDAAAARARFEHALELDPTFAESHGSLAVLAATEGQREEAERKVEVAMRLDRNCYSAALALVLLRAAKGDQEGARRIFERAINSRVDGSGRTIAQSLARMGTPNT